VTLEEFLRVKWPAVPKSCGQCKKKKGNRTKGFLTDSDTFSLKLTLKVQLELMIIKCLYYKKYNHFLYVFVNDKKMEFHLYEFLDPEYVDVGVEISILCSLQGKL